MSALLVENDSVGPETLLRRVCLCDAYGCFCVARVYGMCDNCLRGKHYDPKYGYNEEVSGWVALFEALNGQCACESQNKNHHFGGRKEDCIAAPLNRWWRNPDDPDLKGIRER